MIRLAHRSRLSALIAVVLLAITAAPLAAGVPEDAWRIEVPGSSIVLRGGTEVGADGRGVPFYEISRDGESFAPRRTTSYELKLRYAEFDPLVAGAIPPVPAELAAGPDTGLFIVQFVTQPLEAFRQAIDAAGGTVIAYLARHAHVVALPAAARDKVARLPYVRWVGPFHPAYRLEPYLRQAPDEVIGTLPYNIMLTSPALEVRKAVGDRIEAIGGTVHTLAGGKLLVRASLSPEQFRQAARWNEVLFVDRWSPYENDMDIGREIGGANYIAMVGGFLGEGVRGEVLDSGFNPDHVDFQSRPLIEHTDRIDISSHGASTSGIIFGDGTGDPMGRGLMPLAQGVIADYDESGLEGSGRYFHTGELAAFEVVFQSCSAGSNRDDEYNNASAEMDAGLFDFQVVHCQSQSNAGNQQSRPQAWAKNIIAVGGVDHENTLDKSDDNLSGASIGPAADGRVKPDLLHFYDSVFTTTCCGAESYTSGFNGTSAATPIVCGHVGLFFEMWSKGTFGNPVDPNGTVYSNRAQPATAKAMVINSAEQYDWTQGGPNGDLTREVQGWGMPDLRRMYDLRDRVIVIDETDILSNLESTRWFVDVEAGEPDLKITMVYSDPPGEPFSNQHRINDLSLHVTSPSGVEYWGNIGLLGGLWSIPGGSNNEIDTVENVFIQSPEAGEWTVEVIAQEVIEDSHVETAELDADYALVISGVPGDQVLCRQSGNAPKLCGPIAGGPQQ